MTHFGERPPRVDLTHWRWTAPHAPWRGCDGDDEYIGEVRFLARSFAWQSGAFDTELAWKAMDEVPDVTLFAPASRCVCCPYDGGLDLFLPSAAARDALRSRFQGWVSAHSRGL